MNLLAVIRDADGMPRRYTTDPWDVVRGYRAEKHRHARERLPLLLVANVDALRLARSAMRRERPEVLDEHPELMGWMEQEIARGDAERKARDRGGAAGQACVSEVQQGMQDHNHGSDSGMELPLFQDTMGAPQHQDADSRKAVARDASAPQEAR